MSDPASNQGNIIIGEGVSAVGNFNVPGLALINGSFEGNLITDELVVGVRGQLVGKVQSRVADVLGKVEEELHVSGKLTVRSSGRIHGLAQYGELEVERGGSLQGLINPMGSDVAVASKRSAAEPVSLPLHVDTLVSTELPSKGEEPPQS
jgi:cytoskeletal protein CcmA (bactofilin family)